MKMESVAYLAGIIDGEGSIFIFSRDNNKSGQSTAPAVQMSITNTNIPLLERCKDIMEQEIIMSQLSRKIFDSKNGTKGRTCFKLVVSNYRHLVSILTAVLPYLVAKKAQALLAIEFASMSSRKGSITRNKQIAMMQEMRFLNTHNYSSSVETMRQSLLFSDDIVRPTAINETVELSGNRIASQLL
jgi:hypothetical protein